MQNTPDNSPLDSSATPKKKFLPSWLKETLIFIIKIGIAGFIIWYICHKDDIDFSKLLLIPVWAILVMSALQCFQHVIAAARWRYLLKIQKVEISLWEAITLNWHSFFYSLVLPGGALGGDVVKATIVYNRLPKGKRLEPAFTIFIDRVIGMVSLFGMILLLSPLVWIYRHHFSNFAWVILAVLLPVCLAGIVCAFGLFYHREISRIPGIKHLMDWADGKSHGKIERLFESFDLYRGAMKPIITWAVLGAFLIHMPAAIIIYVAALGLHAVEALKQALPFWETVFTTSAANTAGMLPSFGGFGLREGTNKVLMEDMTGIAGGDVLLPVFTYSALLIIFNLLGGIWMFVKHKETMTPPSDDESSGASEG